MNIHDSHSHYMFQHKGCILILRILALLVNLLEYTKVSRESNTEGLGAA